jgi:glycosyltransferase involved in cell wall biosynthesis
MKIAFVNIYQGKTERGLETFVTELSKRLGKKHKVDILGAASGSLPRWPLLWRVYLDPHGVKIAFFTLKILPKLWSEKYDIVFALNGGWQPALVRVLTWLHGGKMIIPGQSGKGWDDRNNLWCFPDCFVALTDDGVNWAKRVNPFVRVEKISNGVDTQKFNPKGEKYKTKLAPPIVICQGAAEPSKRLDLAIEAVARTKSMNLLVVGTGSRSKEINDMGSKLLGKRFEMIHVAHESMPSVYRVGNLFTLPSLPTEAFGISYIEAMATNLPVVATDNPARREVVGDAGIYVDPVDTEKYKNALEKALSIDWGNKPILQAKKFDWELIASSYETLLKTLEE